MDLLAFLNMIAPLSEDLTAHLFKILKLKKLRTKDIWLRPGQVCSSIAFVQSGLLRCYYTKHGKQINSWFMREGDVIIAVRSFYTQTRSTQYIEALSDSELLYITNEELEELYCLFPEFNLHGRMLTQKYYMLADDRVENIRSLTAPERYEYLATFHQELLMYIQAKHLASYLGVTEETFSRIRTAFNRSKIKRTDFTNGI